MSAIIYEKQTNGLYPTGQRSVSTFPSGLIRVDQTFVCKTSAASTHRAALAVGANMPGGSSPAIDGLKIFPEPQEKRRDDGFTEFIVSSYGRTTTGTSINESYTSRFWGRYVYSRKEISLQYVIKSGEALIKYPQIDTSWLMQDMDWSMSVKLKTSGDTLINQSFNLDGYYFPTFVFSFVGSGSVTLAGTAVDQTIISGIGPDSVKSQTINKKNNLSNLPLDITVTGDVRSATLKKSNTQPAPVDLSQGWWLLAESKVTNFGSFKDVSVNFRSY